MRLQRNQSHRTDQLDRDRTIISRSGGVDSEADEIEPITTDRGRRLIGEVVTAAMRAVHLQEAEDASSHPVCTSLRHTSSRDRDSEGAAVVEHPFLVVIVPRTTKVIP